MDFDSRKDTTPLLVGAGNDAAPGQGVAKKRCSTPQIQSTLAVKTLLRHHRWVGLHTETIKATFTLRHHRGCSYS